MSLAYFGLVWPLLPGATQMELDRAFELYSLPTCHTPLSAREARVWLRNSEAKSGDRSAQ